MNWIAENGELIMRLTVEHIRLSLIPIGAAVVIALPMGWVAHRYGWLRAPILTLFSLLYTVPSLALFVILPPLLGISVVSKVNVTIALTIYGVALLVRPITTGFDAVDASVRHSATAMGYSPRQQFWLVELPLAAPVIISGVRVMAVSTVSLVTVGILIGVESLGYLFTNGLQRRIIEEVFTGVVMTVLVALLFDLVVMLIGRAVTPWTRSPRVMRAAGAVS